MSSPPPRYAPHRPFPPYRYVPGRHPHPTRDAAGHSRHLAAQALEPVSGASWAGHEPYRFACDLYNHGWFWEAHEAWESLWHLATRGSPERALLQGLIQVAGAHLKRHIGQEDGAGRLAARADVHLARAEPHAGPDGLLLGVAVGSFRGSVRRWFATPAPQVPWPTLRLGP